MGPDHTIVFGVKDAWALQISRARALGSAALAGHELHWRPCLENLDLDDDSDFCWPSENGRSRPQPEIGSCTAT